MRYGNFLHDDNKLLPTSWQEQFAIASFSKPRPYHGATS
jgi:hypothetical protein